MFYKSSQRSTVLDRRASAHAMDDHDNAIEEEGFAYDDHEGDYVLEEIARAARAEADSATGSTYSTASKDRLSPFESELLSAWSEK